MTPISMLLMICACAGISYLVIAAILKGPKIGALIVGAALAVVLFPVAVYAADGSATASSSPDPLQALINHYTHVLALGALALGVKLWRYITKKSHASDNDLAMKLARQVVLKFEQLWRTGKIAANERKPKALASWHQVAKQHKLPQAIIDIGDDFIEAAIGELNHAKPPRLPLPKAAA